MEKETCAARAKSYISNEELVGSLKQNVMVNRLTNAPLNVHSRWNLKRTFKFFGDMCRGQFTVHREGFQGSYIPSPIQNRTCRGFVVKAVLHLHRFSIIFEASSHPRISWTRMLCAGTSCDAARRVPVALSTSRSLEGIAASNTRDEFDWEELYHSDNLELSANLNVEQYTYPPSWFKIISGAQWLSNPSTRASSRVNVSSIKVVPDSSGPSPYSHVSSLGWVPQGPHIGFSPSHLFKWVTERTQKKEWEERTIFKNLYK